MGFRVLPLLLRYLRLSFPAILAVTQHYIYPGSHPRLGRRQQVILGRIVDLAASLDGEPGMAAASPSFSCRWGFRSCLSQGTQGKGAVVL